MDAHRLSRADAAHNDFMAIGEQLWEEVEAGRKYRLSDGTELSFQTRNGDGVEGVTAEELITVLVDRLKALRKQNSSEAARSISVAITMMEDSENWLARWDADRRRERKRSAGIIFEQRGIRVNDKELAAA